VFPALVAAIVIATIVRRRARETDGASS